MATYPYVPAWYDNYGPRLATLGLMYHMAEGGGTVGYLDKSGTPPPRGVSVHGVIEYSGRFVQMLPWNEVSGSLNPSNRSTNKAYFGHQHLVDVLGNLWTNPNQAVLSIEIEGFAAKGPNAAQVASAIAWGADMRRRYPTLRGALGHADQTDTKGCPGATTMMRAIFDGVGGHGLWHPHEVVDVDSFVVPEKATLAKVRLGGVLYDNAAMKASPGNVTVSPAREFVFIGWHPTNADARIIAYEPPTNDPNVTSRAMFVDKDDITVRLAPNGDCHDVQARLDVANSRISRAATDLGATPPSPI